MNIKGEEKMKYWKNINIFVIIVLTICIINDLYAGSPNRRGTAGATELLIPVGSAGVGMSGSILATANGLDALHWNPAGLARSVNSVDIMFSNLTYIADIDVNYLAASVNIEDIGCIATSIKSLSFGDIEITTIDKPEGTGVTFSPTYLTIGLTFARRMSDRIFFGVSTKMIYESVIQANATAFAFDLGLQYKAGETGFNFGIVLKNIGTKGRFDGSSFDRFVLDPEQPPEYQAQPLRLRTAEFDLPTTLEMGLSYNYPLFIDHLLSLNTTFVNNNYSNDEYRFGLEYSYNNFLFARAGYSHSEGVPSLFENIYGPSFGMGVKYNISGIEFVVDYAYRQTKFFSGNQWLSLRLGF